MFAGKNKTEEKEAATDANIVPGSARKQQRHPTPGEKSEDRNPAYQQQRVLPLRHYRGIVGWINGGQGKERNNISCPRIMRVFVHVQSFRDLSIRVSSPFVLRREKERERNIFIKYRRISFAVTLITNVRSSRIDRLCLLVRRGASSNNVNKTLSRNISLE